MEQYGCPRMDRPVSMAVTARRGIAIRAQPPVGKWPVFVLLAVLAILPACGCAGGKVTLRSVPKSPLVEQLDLASRSGPKPTPRTVQLLRVYNLGHELDGDIRPLLDKLQAINDREPSAVNVYALAELSFLGGKKVEWHDKQAALGLYGAAVLHAYDYLFDPRFAATRNQYDPQYRGACDLYNGALEAALRIICEKKELVPGRTKTIRTSSGLWDITFVLCSDGAPSTLVQPTGYDASKGPLYPPVSHATGRTWRPEDFDRFEFVSDYEVRGLKNLYVQHGLGVPLIALRRSSRRPLPEEKYYPPGLSFPVSAFLRPVGESSSPGKPNHVRKQCLLELYDPLCCEEIWVAGQRVPLESDLTTPLAFFLSRPELESLATVGLLRPEMLLALRPDRPDPIMGLYMAQPYEPGKIPVVMVHGLWSSPMTWMEMFNDLRSQPEIRARYQFWFYLYPTGQPFWLSAAQLRRDLAEARRFLDPQHREPALDQMVLIGHSMGGLVARLQTLQSGDDYWRLVCKVPLEQLHADAETRRRLQETFFFLPNPSVRRVISFGTPYHGSTFSNHTTQWLLRKMIHLPQAILNSQQKLFRENADAFPEHSLLRIDTSIDSLSPESPILPVMLAGKKAPWVTYHNILGVMPKKWWTELLGGEGDGVVLRESAHLDDAVSEIIVPADHSTLHAHPASVLEVRRILLEHLAELEGRTATAQRRKNLRRNETQVLDRPLHFVTDLRILVRQ